LKKTRGNIQEDGRRKREKQKKKKNSPLYQGKRGKEERENGPL